MPVPPREVTADERRQLILAAATKLFAEKGIRDTTNKEIAQAAGVTAAALYWYFPTKDALFWAVVKQKADRIHDIQGLLEAAMEAPPALVLTNVATLYLNTLSCGEDKHFLKLMLAEGLRRPDIAAFFREEMLGTLFSFLQRYLDHQVELGRLRPHKTDISLQQFLGTLMSMILRNYLEDGWLFKVSIPVAVEQVVQSFLHGFAVTKTSPVQTGSQDKQSDLGGRTC